MNTHAQLSKLTLQIGVLILASQLLFACDYMPSITGPSLSTDNMSLRKKSLHGEETTLQASFSAALTPLEDLGLRKREIPDNLKIVARDPYASPQAECTAIKDELTLLSIQLGEDPGAVKPALSAREEYVEEGTNMLQDTVVSLIRRQTDIIPVRGVVRRLTGAGKHERKVNQALEAGKLRRAYLRGYADAKFGQACIPKPQIVTADTKESMDLLERLSSAATGEEKKPEEGVEVADK